MQRMRRGKAQIAPIEFDHRDSKALRQGDQMSHGVWISPRRAGNDERIVGCCQHGRRRFNRVWIGVQTSAPVTLNAGWNTIRLTKGDLYAEVDYLELQ